MNRRFAGLGGILVLGALLLTGWAGPGASPRAGATKLSGRVTISFAEAMSSGTQKPALQHLVNRFEQSHRGIHVNLVVEPNYSTLQQKEEAAVAAGNPPTIGQAYENWAAAYANAHAIIPLTPFVTGPAGISATAKKAFWSGIWSDLALPDGKIWMWPFNKSDYVLYYNASLLSADHLSVPTTWSQWASDAAAITHGGSWAESMDTGTTSAPANGTYLYLSMVRAYGGQWTVKGRPDFAAKPFVQAMDLLLQLVKEGALKIGTNYPGQTALDAGRSAFDISTIAGYPYVVSGAGHRFTLGIAAIPSGPAGQGNALQGTNVVLFAKTTAAQRAAAWSFMTWLTEPTQTAYWAEQTGYLPVTRAALPLMAAYNRTHNYQVVAAASLQDATGTPPYAWWTEAVGAIANALQAVLSGGAPPANALGYAEQQALAAAR